MTRCIVTNVAAGCTERLVLDPGAGWVGGWVGGWLSVLYGTSVFFMPLTISDQPYYVSGCYLFFSHLPIVLLCRTVIKCMYVCIHKCMCVCVCACVTAASLSAAPPPASPLPSCSCSWEVTQFPVIQRGCLRRLAAVAVLHAPLIPTVTAP